MPTIKQFIQPYFIEIDSNGVLIALCARFSALLQNRNITVYPDHLLADLFAQLGQPATIPELREPEITGLPDIIDLTVSGNDHKPFVIRWTTVAVPPGEDHAGGWQLTGTRIPAAQVRPREEGREYPDRREEEGPLQAKLFHYVTDIVIATDLQYQVRYWNAAAEKFYEIPATEAIGRNFRNLTRNEYLRTSEEEVFHSFREQGSWEGEVLYISPGNRKKSYLLTALGYLREGEERHSGIVIVQKDITDNKIAQQDRKRAEIQLHHYSRQITNLLDSITDGFFVLDRNFRVTLWNHEAERITRLSAEGIIGQVIWEKLPALVDTDTYLYLQKAFSRRMTVTFEQYNEHFERWLEMSIYPSDQGLFAYFKDVSVRKEHEMLLALEKKVLELNSNNKASLQTILNYFLKGIEKIFPGMYCSVLILSEDGLQLRHLSAPGMAPQYTQAVDGLRIGPKAGSCGTAIYRKEKVIVTDIGTDPLWDDYRELALSFGLKACWSFPILNAREEALAAFAVYYKTSRSPAGPELDIIERAANLLTIIIESKKAEEELNISNERYMLATKATNDAIWDRDIRTELYFWGEGFYQQFGYKPGPKVRTRKFWEQHVHPEDRPRVLKKMEQFVEDRAKDLWKDEYRFRKADGKYALISDRGFLIFGKEGHVIRMVGSIQDITQKREMEEKLLNQELNKQKLISQAMVDAQERERAEIGKELHDNINQILSTTKLYLELAKTDNKERLGLINRSAENIHEAIHEIRNISRSLVPSSIGDLGLLDSIADLVESIRTTRAIHVEFYPVGKFDEQISDKEKLMLFRIIQEQVNNVLKHSNARNLIIELILDEVEKKIELNITDDGAGFSPENIRNRKGLGLSNIMSRANLFGGKVTIMSAPGQGCKLRVQVPVQ